MASPPPSPNPAPNPSEKEALLTNEMESVDFASLLADLESMPHTNINATVASILSLGFFTATCWTMQVRTPSSQRYKITRTGWKEFTVLAEACDEADDE